MSIHLTKLFLLIPLLFTNTFRPSEQTQLLINHLGYSSHGPKKVILQTHSDRVPGDFELVNKQGEVVFKGQFEKGGTVDQWHTGKAYAGIFTDLQLTGQFRVVANLNEEISSEWFPISESGYATQCISKIIEGFEHEKCVDTYDAKDAQIPFFGDRKDLVDVRGGWYDASGEKGKYLSHLCFTNYMNPQQTPLLVWGLMKSAESISKADNVTSEQLLTEAAYGADFLTRMQDPDGYFYLTIFAKWSWETEQREICSYSGQHGEKGDDYQAGFREGGGLAIAALARAAHIGLGGEFNSNTYLNTAVKGYAHLLDHNLQYADDGHENIIDDYCALMAATELFVATNEPSYLEDSRKRMEKLTNRLTRDGTYTGWWKADDTGERPYFHGAEAGLPLVALAQYLEVEKKDNFREIAINAIKLSVDFELAITSEVNNPFGYPRQYIKEIDSSDKRGAFFIPHKNESGYWWQGENARLSSLATGFNLALPYLDETQKNAAASYATDQMNWVLGLNPYDVSMLEGMGRNNPDYREGDESLNYPGGVCNGITAGFVNENDIAFMPLPYNDDISQRWRWSEQWLLHGAWLMLALATGSAN